MSQASALRHPLPTPRSGARGRASTTRGGPVGLRVVPAVIGRTGTATFAVICVAVLTIALLTLLMLNAQLAQGAFALHDLQVRSGTLEDERHELTRALDAERNPSALARAALGMGMVPAKSMAFVRLSDGAILGVAEPAKGDRPLQVVTSPRIPPPAPVVVSVDPAAPAAPGATAPATPAPTPGAPAVGQPVPDDPAAATDPEVPVAPTAPVTPAAG
ncbi:MAG: hypothetical protein IPL45_08330 [Actinomycetales bacterium]|nr:hypothetical protein [Actinomycetales bacterium]